MHGSLLRILEHIRMINQACSGVYRSLTEHETSQLIAQGNRADCWDKIRICDGYPLDRIFDCRFCGRVGLGAKWTAHHDSVISCELERSTFQNCWIGWGVTIRDTRLVLNTIVGTDVRIEGCGEISFTPGAWFGIGAEMSVVETGQRRFVLHPGVNLEQHELFTGPDQNNLADQWMEEVRDFYHQMEPCAGVIGNGSVILDTPVVRDCYLGEESYICAAQRVSQSALLSEMDAPVNVADGAIVQMAVLFPQSEISGQSFVDHSMLMEAASVAKHAKVSCSIVGPNSHVQEGEVTSCVMGPFMGFHHQALLISAYWPAGKGNIAYGCNCGSNHTGKAPDQEMWGGEGLFIGLGCNIKYPCNFRQAPYSIIATGTDIPPQSVSMPFSLLVKPPSQVSELACECNEIVPGWSLRHNLYALLRNESKFKQRDGTRAKSVEYRIFRSDIMAMVLQALAVLENLSGKDFYTAGDSAGLGMNFLRESNRVKAIDDYRGMVRFTILRDLFGDRLEWTATQAQRQLQDLLAEPSLKKFFSVEECQSPVTRSKQIYFNLLDQQRQSVFLAKQRDDNKGVQIIPDYREIHLCAGDDPLVKELETLHEVEKQRINEHLPD